MSMFIKLEYRLRTNIGNREYLQVTLKSIRTSILGILTFKAKLNTDKLHIGEDIGEYSMYAIPT